MGKSSSKKISGRHTTTIPAANPIVKEADSRPEVSGIVLGPIIAGKSGGSPRLDTEDTKTGLKCTVRGSTGIQVIYVVTSDRHATASALHAVAPEGRGKQRKKQHNGPAPLPTDICYPRNGTKNRWPF